MPEGLKFLAQFDVIEDLTIEDQHQLTILADHRLMSRGRKIQNREPSNSESD